MTTAGVPAAWPADVIHVNEDGWVLINRGRRHGVSAGLRLLVVGQGIRELRDLYAAEAAGDTPPLALRIRRTYEQLEVIHAEEDCAVAIATRTPPERRPQVYTGPEGELLVWVPLPAGFTWPRLADADDTADLPPDDGYDEESAGDTEDVETAAAPDAAREGDEETPDSEAAEQDKDEESTTTMADTPPERGEQDDERWEEALPLNGVSVGDLVVPAVPVAGSGTAPASGAAASEAPGNPFEAGRSYDWMKPES
jgi:hypothetical protein